MAAARRQDGFGDDEHHSFADKTGASLLYLRRNAGLSPRICLLHREIIHQTPRGSIVPSGVFLVSFATQPKALGEHSTSPHEASFSHPTKHRHVDGDLDSYALVTSQ